jgi:hypothetical protein
VNPRQAHELYLAFCLQRALDDERHQHRTSGKMLETLASFDSGENQVYGFVADLVVISNVAVAAAVTASSLLRLITVIVDTEAVAAALGSVTTQKAGWMW